MKIDHNRRSQSYTAFEILTAASIGRLRDFQDRQTIAENESISSLPFSTHSAVEMTPCAIDVDTDIDKSRLGLHSHLLLPSESRKQLACYDRSRSFNVIEIGTNQKPINATSY